MNERRYREAERKLWESVGATPDEVRIPLACTGTRIRVQVVGEGPPVVLLHGGPNAGSTWAPLVPYLPGFRLHIIDRPGTGLSEDFVIPYARLLETADRFVGDVLDGLELDRAHVIGSSFGGLLALRSAAAAPERFDRMVQMACPALADGMKTPDFMKPMRFRFVRWLAPKLPPSRKVNDDIMRQIGHGPSLQAGTLDSFSEWYLDLARYTNTMKNDMAMIGQVMAQTVPSSTGALPDATLSAISTPTHFIWGADDGFGGEELARRLVGTMPNASLEMLERSGHLPWLDFPERVGARTVEFLRPARP